MKAHAAHPNAWIAFRGCFNLFADSLNCQQWGNEVRARFDKVWDRLAALNAEFSEEQLATDIR